MKLRFVGLSGPVFIVAFVAALVPSAAYAAANPNNHGHHYHYGWVHHHSLPPLASILLPSGGEDTTGAQNWVAVAVPAAVLPDVPTVITPDLPVMVPAGEIVPTAQPPVAGRDLWWVVIILATVVAANVTLGVLAVGRGGHYALRRSLAMAGIRL